MFTEMNTRYKLGMLGLLSFQLAYSQEKVENKPNVILILMDDMGYGDLNCYGAVEYETPNLDLLANEGVQFTHYYSPQAVSSASRAGLLTGCYPNRVGIDGALFPSSTTGINPGEETIAEVLKQKGYRTGAIGKWHLGHQKEFLPLQNGFDEYFGLPYSNDMWPVEFDGTETKDTSKWIGKCPILPLIEGNNKVGEVRTLADQGKLTTMYTERAIKFIENNKNKPFFLYLANSMVHVPLGVSEKFKNKSKQGKYGDVMMEVDWQMGEIMKTIHKYKLDEKTIIIFTSDNGPWINFGNHAGSTGALKEAKGTTWEGGQRVPFIVRWKGKFPEGKICNKIACGIDILPTLAAITNAPLPKNKIDGVNILPLFQGNDSIFPRNTLLYYYRENSLEAVQKDYWKLVLPHKYYSYENTLPKNDGYKGPVRSDSVNTMLLFDLRRDPGERYNVIEQNPDKVKELMVIVEEARQDLGDDLTNNEGKNRRKPGELKK